MILKLILATTVVIGIILGQWISEDSSIWIGLIYGVTLFLLVVVLIGKIIYKKQRKSAEKIVNPEFIEVYTQIVTAGLSPEKVDVINREAIRELLVEVYTWPEESAYWALSMVNSALLGNNEKFEELERKMNLIEKRFIFKIIRKIVAIK